MGIKQPFYRIIRPGAPVYMYVNDKRYASDRSQLSRSYLSIENELRSVFEFIEPAEQNIHTFSTRLYSLLLRACTEVELNCREILEANGLREKNKNFNVETYKLLEHSSFLSKYEISFENWRVADASGNIEYIDKKFFPFKNFDLGISRSPDWYQAYNKVKHNRSEQFEKANLENCMNAVAAVLVLLYSQFGASCIAPYGDKRMRLSTGDDFLFDENVIFGITPPKREDWGENIYDFNWDELSKTKEPFQKYDFKIYCRIL